MIKFSEWLKIRRNQFLFFRPVLLKTIFGISKFFKPRIFHSSDLSFFVVQFPILNFNLLHPLSNVRKIYSRHDLNHHSFLVYLGYLSQITPVHTNPNPNVLLHLKVTLNDFFILENIRKQLKLYFLQSIKTQPLQTL